MRETVIQAAESDADSLFNADFVIGEFRRSTFRNPYLGNYLDYCHEKMNAALPRHQPPLDGHLIIRDQAGQCARLANTAGRLLNDYPQINHPQPGEITPQ